VFRPAFCLLTAVTGRNHPLGLARVTWHLPIVTNLCLGKTNLLTHGRYNYNQAAPINHSWSENALAPG
jgi:hypothetical protein